MRGMLQGPSLLRMGALKVITMDPWRYRWMTQELSGRGEWGRKKMFSQIGKKWRARRGFQADWLFHGLVKAEPSSEVLNIDKPSVGFDQRAFLFRVSRRSDNELAPSILLYCHTANEHT